MTAERLSVDDERVLREVEEAFWEHERALVENDLPTLDRLFWDDPRTVRFGPTESLFGIDRIRAFRSARPTGDLAREPLRVLVTAFGSDVAVASAEFLRTASGRTVRQQQTWVRTAEGWRVVAAHVSLLDQPAP